MTPGEAAAGIPSIRPIFRPGTIVASRRVQTDRADFWNDFASDTYTMLRGLQDQKDGLIPDWGYGDGRSKDGGEGQFGYEAVRNPWRVALDYAWSGNADARAFLQRMSQTVDARGGIAAMADTDDFEDKRNSAFLGSLSLSGLAVSEQKLQGYVSRVAGLRGCRRQVVLSGHAARVVPDDGRRLLPRELLSPANRSHGGPCRRGRASVAPGPSSVPHIVRHRLSCGGQVQAARARSSSFSCISLTVKRARRSTAANDSPRRICFLVRGSLGRPSGSAQQRKPR